MSPCAVDLGSRPQWSCRAGNGIPIVMFACELPENMVVSLARPGGRATGVDAELSAKRVEFLREILPELKRRAVIYNPKDANKRVEMRNLDSVAAALPKQPLESKGVDSLASVRPWIRSRSVRRR